MTARAHVTLLPWVAAASLAVLAVARPAAADQVALQPLKDNTIFSESGNLSDGQGVGLFAGVTGGSATRRALLAFDVAGAIPAGATITGAQLTLLVTRSNAGSETMALHRLVADWGEGASNSTEMGGGMGAPAATGDATWRFRFFNSARWASDGGDFIAAASAVQTVPNSGSVTWGSTAQMIADVQGWLDAPNGNFGWIVRGNETHSGTTKRFASRQTGTAASRPKLTISFDPPAAGATATASPTATQAPTGTPSATARQPTATGTATVTRTIATTATATATATVSAALPTATSTASAVLTPTTLPTSSATATTTQSPPPTVTMTPTVSPPPAETVTATALSTSTATPEVATPTATETPLTISCVGDCNGSGDVSIDELILGVNIALGSQPLALCPAFDSSGNGSVEINELIAAVNNALNGCP